MKIKKQKANKSFSSVEEEEQQNGTAKADGKTVLVTREGLKKLKEELEYLVKVKRKEIVERIKEAISYGDLSENSEYEDAKNEQAFIEGRILELEEKIKHAKIIDERKKKTGAIVQMGTTVSIKNLVKEGEEVEEYVIVGSTESDPINNRISNESPIGRALLDKKVGDKIDFVAPSGIMRYKIVSLK